MNEFQQIFPNGFNPNDFKEDRRAWVTTENPRQALIKEMQSYGMKPDQWVAPDKINRFPDAEDKPGGKAGWCWFTMLDSQILIARFGSFRGNPELVKWCNKNTDYMSDGERDKMNAAMAAAAKAHELALIETQANAARVAQERYNAARLADVTHPYLKRKMIGPHGAKIYDGNLLIPIFIEGEITSYQTIAMNGDKRFKTGGKIKGGSYVIDGETDVIFVCEGFATGASIREATNKRVYVAFNANNLLDVTREVVQKEKGRIVVAADDDRFKEVNTGIKAAQFIYENISGVGMIAPRFDDGHDGTDFNDMAVLYGPNNVAEYIDSCLNAKPKYQVNVVKQTNLEDRPGGILNDIIDYYNATSGNYQPGFAVQTALAIGSFVCGRNFATDQDNFSALYFLNVGRTATGKEHCKTVVERVLAAAGLDRQISGDGFTSPGAVMSALLSKPRTISIIDEMGIYLQASAGSSGSMMKEANSTLMQAYGRCNTTLRPKNYSSMTLGKKADDLKDREVKNPSLTLVGITTPSTFFDAITKRDILSGFLNRFILHISEVEPSVRKRVAPIEVPSKIIRWIEAINTRAKAAGNIIPMAEEEPKIVRIMFSDAAFEIQQIFEKFCVNKIKILEPRGLDGLPGRANEQAMRIALICALSRDPNTEIIADIDMKWAVEYMTEALNAMINTVDQNMRHGKWDAVSMDIYKAIHSYGERGVTLREMQSGSSVFKSVDTRQLKEILASLVEGEMITVKTEQTSRGRPTARYIGIV